MKWQRMIGPARSLAVAIVAAGLLAIPDAHAVNPHRDEAREAYLDRLMLAESGGRDDASNPRSTALGPYQFIVSTFIEVTRRHFTAEVAGMSDAELLALRTSRAFARRAASAYTDDCSTALAAAGLPASYANLRLAFLLGPGGAITVLRADAAAPLASLLARNVIAANPFMATLTAGDLIARTAREAGSVGLARVPQQTAVMALKPVTKPAIQVTCDLDRPSCRRWLTLAERRTARLARVARR